MAFHPLESGQRQTGLGGDHQKTPTKSPTTSAQSLDEIGSLPNRNITTPRRHPWCFGIGCVLGKYGFSNGKTMLATTDDILIYDPQECQSCESW